MRRLPKLPTSYRTQAFRLFVSTLQTDGLLREFFKTWRVWDGTAGEETQWVELELPWVRLTPKAGDAGFADTCSQRSDLVVKVEVVIPGTDADMLLDLWTAVERALSPADPVKRGAFQAVKVLAVEPTLPAFTAETTPNGKVLVCSGEVRLWMMLPI